LTVGAPDRKLLTVDKPVRDAIYATEPIEVVDANTFDVLITEIDTVRKTCKVSLLNDDDPNRRFDAIITDPAMDVSNNQYVNAVAMAKPLRVTAKTQLKGGALYKFYISDTAA
jgi:hypothetical protein